MNSKRNAQPNNAAFAFTFFQAFDFEGLYWRWQFKNTSVSLG